jgi:predicted nuclease of predicted toxin-antitoxin system
MGISPATCAFLRDLGHDAVHLHDQGLDRLPDSDILEKARIESRILLTHDLDFGELMAVSGAQSPTVIVFRVRDMRPRSVNSQLHYVLSSHQETLEHGAIASITDGQVRIRSLPI